MLAKQASDDGLPDLTTLYSAEEAKELGLIFEYPMESPYACTWDRRNDFDGTEVDLGWIGESAEGVWICVHPRVALLAMPELWRIVALVVAGQAEIYESDLHNLSAFEYQCKLVMLEALQRKFKVEEKGIG